MKLFSYIVARDFGFAPNPFHGCCTLATCKPKIRAVAAIGDWIIGTGAKTKYKLAGHLIFAMQVSEAMTFSEYWRNGRFRCKRPVMNGSLKQLYGDNIYRRHGERWLQADSHHSLPHGAPNPKNITVDTTVDRVLIASRFVYWGRAAPEIPKRFRPFRPTDKDVCCDRVGHRKHSDELARTFEHWLEEVGHWGLQDYPLEFEQHRRNNPPDNVGAGRLAKPKVSAPHTLRVARESGRS